MIIEIILLISFLLATTFIISYLRFYVSNLGISSYKYNITEDMENAAIGAFVFFIITSSFALILFGLGILHWDIFPMTISSIGGISLGIFLHPILLYRSIRSSVDKEKDKIIDKKVLQVAVKYGGVVTISHLVLEADLSIEEAYRALKRFVDAGEAYLKQSGNLRFWDFPSARAHLTKIDYEIIESLIEAGGRIKKIELINKLISKYSWSIEVIEQGINRLEMNGILKYDRLTDELRLLGISIKD
jgi:hypothetical protein